MSALGGVDGSKIPALPWREARRNRHQEAALPSWAIREWVEAATQLGARDAA